jgi:GT2 family glycosyltransferase
MMSEGVMSANVTNPTVGIATAGRREQLRLTLLELAKQTELPTIVVICPADHNDYDESIEASLPYPIKVVFGGRGLPLQRNIILSVCSDTDVLIFFDDDFYPSVNFLAETSLLMKDERIVMARGCLLMDGANNSGVSHEDAINLITNQSPLLPTEISVSDTYGAYGCNMIVRMKPVREHNLRFDENLPLYGWQEDIDFSRSMAPYGRIVMSRRLTGVHLAVKGGRTSGIRFGYSQIANPLYLYKKGTMDLSYSLKLISKNFLANLGRSILPEPWVDRKGRLKGNFMAFGDLFRSRLHPTRILELD